MREEKEKEKQTLEKENLDDIAISSFCCLSFSRSFLGCILMMTTRIVMTVLMRVMVVWDEGFDYPLHPLPSLSFKEQNIYG